MTALSTLVTQRDAFIAWWSYYQTTTAPFEKDRAVSTMREILAVAQNAPEHGGGRDGSFTPEEWTAARDLLDAVKAVNEWQDRVSLLAQKVARFQ